jgi:hypothetical protein
LSRNCDSTDRVHQNGAILEVALQKWDSQFALQSLNPGTGRWLFRGINQFGGELGVMGREDAAHKNMQGGISVDQ